LQERPAQQLIREIGTESEMKYDWVFVGSGTWKHPDTGEEIYLGDGGEFICVSNFGAATLDLPIESSSEAYGLLFQAYTERIPDLGTLVLLVLEPEVESSVAPPAGSSDAAAPSSREKLAQPDQSKGG
jgi:hypothetical protein